MARKKLPTGIQSFREIREEGMYYVDKTGYAKRLVDGDKHNFLSRPRRFGKSLFVDTLKHLFEGNEELFRGLYIHDKWDWGVEYPVLRLDFSGWGSKTSSDLNDDVMTQLGAVEKQEGVSTTARTAGPRFFELVKALHEKKKQRVVILVDEYDKPIFDLLGKPELAEANRDYLAGLYGNIKRCEDDIKFTFLTGVSKFAHAGIFTGLNNLNDISLDPGFSSICGYTDSDIDTVFAKEMKRLHREKIGREEIREWYDGYSWRGKENVYNPFSILKLFSKREFYAWWYTTATPTFLIETLKSRAIAGTLDLAEMTAGNDLLSSFDIGSIEDSALLFQSGYLTIAREEKKKGGTDYILDFPNREVRQSLHQGLLRAIAPKVKVALQTKQLREALESGNIDAVEAHLRALFSDISYTMYNPKDIENYEGIYASNAHTCLAATGLVVRPEDPTSKGRIDMTVEAGTHIYIFEFKVLGGKVKRGAAMKQLRERNYADKYRARGVPIHLIGVEFGSKERNIKHFDIETIPARRTSGRKKGARKKTVRKKTTRKKSGEAKRTRKKTTRKKSARKKRSPRR